MNEAALSEFSRASLKFPTLALETKGRKEGGNRPIEGEDEKRKMTNGHWDERGLSKTPAPLHSPGAARRRACRAGGQWRALVLQGAKVLATVETP